MRADTFWYLYIEVHGIKCQNIVTLMARDVSRHFAHPTLLKNYLIFGIFPIVWSSINLENTTNRKLDLFLTSGEGGDIYSVGFFRES